MKGNYRKAYPKLIRKEWNFPKFQEGASIEDLQSIQRKCDCGSSEPPLEPAEPSGDCVLDEYTACGEKGIDTEDIYNGTLPIVYLRAAEDNPPYIYVPRFNDVGVCFSKTSEGIDCASAAAGPLIGFNDWVKLPEDNSGKTPCQRPPCKERNRWDGNPVDLGDCTWSSDPETLDFAEEGGEESFTVVTPFGCSYDLVNRNGDTWFDFTPTSGLAGKAISVTCDENTGNSRTGYIDVVTRVESKMWLVGATVATCTITQEAGAVPGACPGHPPLLNLYTVTGGPLITASNGGGCLPLASAPGPIIWDGVVSFVAPCRWELAANTYSWSTPACYIQFAQITLSAGLFWELILGTNVPGPLYINTPYRKNFGSTPVGVYTSVYGCNPLTLTVF